MANSQAPPMTTRRARDMIVVTELKTFHAVLFTPRMKVFAEDGNERGT